MGGGEWLYEVRTIHYIVVLPIRGKPLSDRDNSLSNKLCND